MVVAAIKIKVYLPWVRSLKEKRMEIKSILEKTRHHFRISAAEVDCQEVHRTAVVAFAAVVCTVGQAERLLQQIADYVQAHTQGEVTGRESVIY